jgi:hypothetical protein
MPQNFHVLLFSNDFPQLCHAGPQTLSVGSVSSSSFPCTHNWELFRGHSLHFHASLPRAGAWCGRSIAHHQHIYHNHRFAVIWLLFSWSYTDLSSPLLFFIRAAVQLSDSCPSPPSLRSPIPLLDCCCCRPLYPLYASYTLLLLQAVFAIFVVAFAFTAFLFFAHVAPTNVSLSMHLPTFLFHLWWIQFVKKWKFDWIAIKYLYRQQVRLEHVLQRIWQPVFLAIFLVFSIWW